MDNFERNAGCVGIVAFAGVLVMSIVWCIIGAAGGMNIEYSSGSRTGVVQKLSKKGLIWKTWEGEVNMGYLTSTGGEKPQLVPEIFEFSTVSESVVKDLERAEKLGGKVTVKYKQYLFRGFNKGKTSYDVTEVVFNGDNE